MSNICFYYEEKIDYISYSREVKSGKSQGILFSIFCGNLVRKNRKRIEGKRKERKKERKEHRTGSVIRSLPKRRIIKKTKARAKEIERSIR